MSYYAVEVAKRKLSNARAALENAMDALDEAAEALTAANDENANDSEVCTTVGQTSEARDGS